MDTHDILFEVTFPHATLEYNAQRYHKYLREQNNLLIEDTNQRTIHFSGLGITNYYFYFLKVFDGVVCSGMTF